MLNELRQGLVYNLEAQSGPVHAPIFTMTVEVIHQLFMIDTVQKRLKKISYFPLTVFLPSSDNDWMESKQVDGEKYIGQGRSKKLARIQAAEAALRNFIQFKDGTALSPVKSAISMDFTSDDHLENNG